MSWVLKYIVALGEKVMADAMSQSLLDSTNWEGYLMMTLSK